MITPEEMREMAERLSKDYPESDSSYFYHATRDAAAMLRSIAAEREADTNTVYLRDLDGTGSMHVCSKGDAGAIAYCPKGAA